MAHFVLDRELDWIINQNWFYYLSPIIDFSTMCFVSRSETREWSSAALQLFNLQNSALHLSWDLNLVGPSKIRNLPTVWVCGFHIETVCTNCCLETDLGKPSLNIWMARTRTKPQVHILVVHTSQSNTTQWKRVFLRKHYLFTHTNLVFLACTIIYTRLKKNHTPCINIHLPTPKPCRKPILHASISSWPFTTLCIHAKEIKGNKVITLITTLH